ncbi:hypothetical protein HYV84_05480, partial [Candidatus Woesearchaeota archaeon]|nr:hypothetical protein [Candidatus Woesearchaeota archaeon]
RFAADSIRFLASNGSEFSLPESLNASFNFSGIKVINFSCASTAYHTILELTTGKHTQAFAFGSLSEYANNDAGSDCTASGYTDGTGQACNNQGSCTGTPHDCMAADQLRSSRLYIQLGGWLMLRHP